MLEKLETIYKKYQEIGSRLCDSDVISDNKLYVKLGKEYKNLEPIASLYERYKVVNKSLCEANEMLKEDCDEDMKQFLNDEVVSITASIDKMQEEAKILLLPKDEHDSKNIIMEIRPGTGGEEASLFGAEIMRMYLKYAERMHWEVDVINLNETEMGGLKEATLMISGNNVYGKLKFESGVHRVQRVPDTETQGRVHTSAITVAVLPEAEDVDISIEEKDIRIDTYRASGAGGQHINKTDSAIRITHFPTGIVVSCQDQRSQIKNREKAFAVLRSKLFDYYAEAQKKNYDSNRKAQVGTGDRSERIRTYNYPQGRVTDHRINLTLYSISTILEGDLDQLIEPLIMADQKAKLDASVE